MRLDDDQFYELCRLNREPLRAEVFVYLPDGSVERLHAPAYLSADSLLAGFRLEREEIW